MRVKDNEKIIAAVKELSMASMMKWEYMCVGVEKSIDEPIAEALNDFGCEGWELVTMVRMDDEALLCAFKRPIPDYTSTE